MHPTPCGTVEPDSTTDDVRKDSDVLLTATASVPSRSTASAIAALATDANLSFTRASNYTHASLFEAAVSAGRQGVESVERAFQLCVPPSLGATQSKLGSELLLAIAAGHDAMAANVDETLSPADRATRATAAYLRAAAAAALVASHAAATVVPEAADTSR